MGISLGTSSSKRHWFVVTSAVICFATAVALLFSQFYRPGTVDYQSPIQWVYTWMWNFLELFPQPATVGTLTSFFSPWRNFMQAHAAFALAWHAVLFFFSIGLGWSLWQRQTWAGRVLGGLCVLKIPVVLGNIAVYGQQFTYCAEGTIYPCSKSLAQRVLPYYGFSIAGVAVSVAAFMFLLRYGLEPPASAGAHPEARPKPLENSGASIGKPIVRGADRVLSSARWIVVTLSLLIAANYAYYLWGWLPLLLPRYSGGGAALGIRTLIPLIVLATASYAFGAVQLMRRVGVFVFALVCGTALACVLAPLLGVGIQDTLGVPFLLGMTIWLTLQMFWLRILLNIGAYLALTVFAIVGLWRAKRDYSSGAGSLGLGLVVPLLFVIAWPQAQSNFKNYSTFTRFPKATPEKKAAGDRQTAAWNLVKIYGHCVFLYRQTHPGPGFPAEAAAMGPANGGESCLTAAQVTGQIDGYQARYEAGRLDSSGRVTQFHVFVLKTEPATDDLGYFLDESGVTTGVTKKSPDVVTSGDTAGNPTGAQATANAPLRRSGALFSAIPYLLQKFHSCLGQIRDADPNKQFPLTAELLLDKIDPYGYPCVPVYDRTQSSRSDFRANSFLVALNTLDAWTVDHPNPRYRVQYIVRPDSSGARTGYVLTAQPVVYNADGVRSYFIDERGALRRTSDNRPAMEYDPEVAKCEAGVPISPCLDVIPSFDLNLP